MNEPQPLESSAVSVDRRRQLRDYQAITSAAKPVGLFTEWPAGTDQQAQPAST